MNKSRPVFLVLLLLVSAVFFNAACAKKAPSSPTESSGAAAIRHPLKGEVLDVSAEKGTLLVKHEAIPGYMPAMTMVFKAEASSLHDLRENQVITGTLVLRGQDYWLEEIKPVSP